MFIDCSDVQSFDKNIPCSYPGPSGFFGTLTALGPWLAYRLRVAQPTLADVTIYI